MSPMEYGQPAWSGKKVSRIVQGTIMLHEEQQEEGFDLLDAVWASGINAFDTAALYGGGTCERVLGRWLEERGLRDEAFVLGKSCHHNSDRRRVTPFDIAADLADSLARQRHDYHDLHCLHRDDPQVPVGAIVEALNEHLDAGRIRAMGGSNWTTARLQEANEYAEARGLKGFAASSPNFSLADEKETPWEGCLSISGPSRAADREWYAARRMPLFTWSSLGRGVLLGAADPGQRRVPARRGRRLQRRLLLARGQLAPPRPRAGAGRREGLHGAAGGPGVGAAAAGAGGVRPRGGPHRRRVPGQRGGFRLGVDGGGDGVAGPAGGGALR